jgi:hypothetical protein
MGDCMVRKRPRVNATVAGTQTALQPMRLWGVCVCSERRTERACWPFWHAVPEMADTVAALPTLSSSCVWPVDADQSLPPRL